jgi:anti-sigma B factor antagonist
MAAERVRGGLVDQPDLQDTGVRPLVLPEIVCLPAEIDLVSSAAVGRQLLGAFRAGVAVVIADMSATEFCDSSGIRQLIIANNHAACTGAELRVVISSLAVRRALQVFGADQMLHLYPDMTSALTGAPDID